MSILSVDEILALIEQSKNDKRFTLTKAEMMSIITKEGLDKYRHIRINASSVSDYDAIIRTINEKCYQVLITGERGIVNANNMFETIEEAYYNLVMELRDIKKIMPGDIKIERNFQKKETNDDEGR